MAKMIIAGALLSIIIVAVIIIIPKLIEWKFQKNITTEINNIKSKPIIEITNKDGFLIHMPDGKTVIETKWNDVTNVELKNESELIVTLLDNTKRVLNKDDYANWINLIKAVPHFIKTNFEFTNFKEGYFSNISCCEICGKIAVKDSICLSCASITFEKYYNEFPDSYKSSMTKLESKTKYLKEAQWFWFEPTNANEKVSFYYKDILFDNCPNWKPLATEFEVLQYHRNNN